MEASKDFLEPNSIWIIFCAPSAHFRQLLVAKAQIARVLLLYGFQYLNCILLPLLRSREYAIEHCFHLIFVMREL